MSTTPVKRASSPKRDAASTRVDSLAVAVLALYLSATATCLVWQYRTSRETAEAILAERAMSKRHSASVTLGRELSGWATPTADAGGVGSRPERWQKVWATLGGLQSSVEAMGSADPERASLLQSIGGIRAALEDLAKGAPGPEQSSFSSLPQYQTAKNLVYDAQERLERLAQQRADSFVDPVEWHQNVRVAFWGLLLLMGGTAGIFLYRNARKQREELQTRQQLIDQLQKLQDKYRGVFDHAVSGIYQATPDGKFINVNPALARMYGYSSPESLMSSLANMGLQDFADSDKRQEMLKTLQEEGSISNAELEVVRADGRTLWVRENVRSVRDPEGKVLYYEGTVEDISESWWSEQRRLVQQATGRILENAQSVAEARPMMLQSICDILGWDMGAVWDVDSAQGVLRCVEVWHASGVDITEFVETMERVTLAPGQGLAGRIWADGEPRWNANLHDDHSSPGAAIALKNGMASVYGVPIKVSGTVRHVAEFFSPQTTASDPELLQLFGVIAAQLGLLIERKTAEEALRKSEMRKAAILHSALDSIISFDAEGRVLEFNPAAEKAFGYRRMEAIGSEITRLMVPPTSDPAEGLNGHGEVNGHTLTIGEVQPISLDGAVYDLTNPPRAWGRRVEMVAKRSDGTEFPAEVAISRIKVDDNKVMFTAFLRDISERKEAERLTSELAAVVQNSNDAIIGCTRDGFIRSWNVGAERLYGYTAEEAINLPLHVLIPEDRLDEFPQALTAVRQGESLTNIETLRLRKDGKKIAVSLTESPIRGENGRITGLSSIARDITERKRLEEELLQSQKMEAVGRLAGGIAHDFNNILTAILGYSDLIIGQIEERHWMYKHLCEVRKAADFAASLTQQLLAFSRRQPLFLRVFAVNDTVRGLQKMVQRVIGEQVQIKTELHSKLGRLKADPSQLEQVMLNLCVNSRDAMPGGGIITISTADVTYLPGEEVTDLNLKDMPAGEYVLLRVSDTGTGIPADVVKHIFEPFFTTKEKGQGTGLGLATCYGIVKQSGGYISVETEIGVGTSFSVYLPRVEESGEKAAPKQDMGQMPGGRETILYVEDELSVRSLTSHILRRLGYTVLEASSGEQARLIVKEKNDLAIDLLFADVVLPDLSGKQLADWVVEQKHETKLLFTSGYVDEGILRRHGVSSEMAFLRKPFTPFDLARKLREVMDGVEVES